MQHCGIERILNDEDPELVWENEGIASYTPEGFEDTEVTSYDSIKYEITCYDSLGNLLGTVLWVD